MKRPLLLLPPLLLCLLPAWGAQAKPPPATVNHGQLEREALSQISRELGYLERLAEEAQRSARADSALQFDYTALRTDLERVRSAVLRHLREPRRIPHPIEPLDAVYGLARPSQDAPQDVDLP